jgi:hypothetical protein
MWRNRQQNVYTLNFVLGMRARGGGCTSYLYGFSFDNISWIPDKNLHVGLFATITTFWAMSFRPLQFQKHSIVIKCNWKTWRFDILERNAVIATTGRDPGPRIHCWELFGVTGVGLSISLSALSKIEQRPCNSITTFDRQCNLISNRGWLLFLAHYPMNLQVHFLRHAIYTHGLTYTS